MDGAYIVKESSGFSKLLKKVLKKYSRTFEDDYNTALQVIVNKLAIYNHDYRKLPKTSAIAGLGASIKLPFCKSEIYIEEAKKYCGRIIYLVDVKQKQIFLSDIYYKSDRENHIPRLLQDCHSEYMALYNNDENSSD